MIIEENQLRPPSPKEMAARYVPLERIRFNWYPKCWGWGNSDIPADHYNYDDKGSCVCGDTCGNADVFDAGFTTLELIEFHKQWAIPYEASMVGHGYDGELALDWKHLSFCETCKQWFLPETDHTTTDTLHLAKVREMMKTLSGGTAS